jgi:hypothetical protein
MIGCCPEVANVPSGTLIRTGIRVNRYGWTGFTQLCGPTYAKSTFTREVLVYFPSISGWITTVDPITGIAEDRQFGEEAQSVQYLRTTLNVESNTRKVFTYWGTLDNVTLVPFMTDTTERSEPVAFPKDSDVLDALASLPFILDATPSKYYDYDTRDRIYDVPQVSFTYAVNQLFVSQYPASDDLRPRPPNVKTQLAVKSKLWTDKEMCLIEGNSLATTCTAHIGPASANLSQGIIVMPGPHAQDINVCHDSTGGWRGDLQTTAAGPACCRA